MAPIQILRMLWARRFVIIVSILSCLMLAALVGKMVPKQYEAKTRVLLDTLAADPVTGQAIPATSAKVYVLAQAEIIKDRRVANAVVDRFGWDTNPAFIAAYRSQSSPNDGGVRRWLTQMVIDNTQVGQAGPSSNILDISYRSTSAESARKIADAVRDAYIEESLAFKRESAANNARWFRQQSEKQKKELASAEERKSDFEKANGIILQDDNVDSESAKLRALTNTAPMAPMMAPGPMVIPPSASSALVAQIESQIAAAQQTLGPNHPDIVALRRQRDAAAAAAQQEMAAARANAAASRQVAVGPSVASQIDAQTRKVLAQRGLIGEAQRLAGEVSILRDQLTKTAAKAADFELQSQSTDIGLQPLGNAVAPQDPVSPYFFLFIMGGLIVGALLGLVIALVLELTSRRVRGIEDLEMLEGLPVLGILPRRGSNNGQGWRYWFGLGRSNRGASAA